MTYREAKAAMIELWDTSGTGCVPCAICGHLAHNPECHHIFESRRFAHTALWNLVPVCNQGDGDCHQVAHTKEGKVEAAQAAYLVHGNGDREVGHAWVQEQIDREGYKCPPSIPEVQDACR